MENELTFEQALKRLNEISVAIQNTDCSLDDALKLFEEGLQLSKVCKDKLESFQQKFNEISAAMENKND